MLNLTKDAKSKVNKYCTQKANIKFKNPGFRKRHERKQPIRVAC